MAPRNPAALETTGRSAEPGRELEVVSHQLQQPVTGTYALSSITDAEFKARLEAMTKGRERVQEIQRALMREGVHFGKLPGREDDKDAKFGLLKPGQELLCALYNYVCEPLIDEVVYGDPQNAESPAIRIRMRCLVHAGDLEGPIVGVGFGAGNTWESKYRYRFSSRTCPSCGRETLLRSKKEAEEGEFAGARPWFCWRKIQGCGAEFAPGDPRIVGQVVGKIPNQDAFDLENTLLKIVEKRARVDATIAATAASDLFTQDVEDGSPEELERIGEEVLGDRGAQGKKAAPKPAAPSSRSTGAPDEAKVRGSYLERIRAHAATIEAARPGRKVIQDSSGIEMFMDLQTLQNLGLGKEPRPLDEMSMEQLVELGKGVAALARQVSKK